MLLLFQLQKRSSSSYFHGKFSREPGQLIFFMPYLVKEVIKLFLMISFSRIPKISLKQSLGTSTPLENKQNSTLIILWWLLDLNNKTPVLIKRGLQTRKLHHNKTWIAATSPIFTCHLVYIRVLTFDMFIRFEEYRKDPWGNIYG